MTSAIQQHSRPNAVGRAWRAFRLWRRSRPFWGGLLTVLAGVEIFGTTQMSLNGLSFQMGPTGFLSWLIPTILVACGLLIWFTPQQRMFYAIVGAMTAVFSLIAVNLGGFFIGLLLGMIGGALGFAWIPGPTTGTAPAAGDATTAVDQHPAVEDRSAGGEVDPGRDQDDVFPLLPPYPSVAASSDDGDADEARSGVYPSSIPSPTPPADDRETGELPRDGHPSGRGPATLAVLLVMLGVAATGLVVVDRELPATAAPCRPPATRPLPSGKPTPPTRPTTAAPRPSTQPSGEPTASAEPTPTTSPEPQDDGNLITDITDGVLGILGGGASATPSATRAPLLSPTAAGAATPEPTASRPAVAPRPATSATAGGTREPVSGRRGGCVTATPTPSASTLPKVAAEPGQPPVNRVPSLLTGSQVTMYGLRLAGITDLPTADGTVRVLKFSMSKAVTDDFVLRVPSGDDQTTTIKSSSLTVQGDVTFYATRFVGWFLGIKLTLTPESPLPPDGIPLDLPVISFGQPEIQLAFVNSDELLAPNLDNDAP